MNGVDRFNRKFVVPVSVALVMLAAIKLAIFFAGGQ